MSVRTYKEEVVVLYLLVELYWNWTRKWKWVMCMHIWVVYHRWEQKGGFQLSEIVHWWRCYAVEKVEYRSFLMSSSINLCGMDAVRNHQCMVMNCLKLICTNLQYFSKKNPMSTCSFLNTRFFKKWVCFFFFQTGNIPENPISVCMYSWKVSSVIINLHADKWLTYCDYIQYKHKANSFHRYMAHAHKYKIT